jgi:hypothetical protein
LRCVLKCFLYLFRELICSHFQPLHSLTD